MVWMPGVGTWLAAVECKRLVARFPFALAYRPNAEHHHFAPAFKRYAAPCQLAPAWILAVVQAARALGWVRDVKRGQPRSHCPLSRRCR